jgi:Meckel syndrome type 1 protein
VATPTPVAPTTSGSAKTAKATTTTAAPAPAITAAKATLIVAPKAASAGALAAQADAIAKLPGNGDSAGAQGPGNQPAAADTSATAAAQGLTPAAVATPAAATPAAASLAASHGAAITEQIATQIATKTDAGKSGFDFALEPAGLGRVDVSLKFDSQGQLSAVLSFDNPAAAAEAQGRASDLQQALQQAGLNVSQGNLSFTSGGGQGGGSGAQTSAPASYGVAGDIASDVPIASVSASGLSTAGGVDITI